MRFVEQEGFGTPGQKPIAQCTQDRKVEARVRQLETQEILPVDTGSDRLGSLAIGQVLAKLHERHEGQPPRGQPRVAPCRKQRGKVLALENGAELITQRQIGMAFGKGGMGHQSGVLGNRANGLKAQGHHGGPSVSGVEA